MSKPTIEEGIGVPTTLFDRVICLLFFRLIICCASLEGLLHPILAMFSLSSLSPPTSHPSSTRPTPTSFATERIAYAPIAPSVFETCQAFKTHTRALHDVRGSSSEHSPSAPAHARTRVEVKHTALAKQQKTLLPQP
ncbi:unnamed protein product [Ectocarpus sp. 4 AP-2014]